MRGFNYMALIGFLDKQLLDGGWMVQILYASLLPTPPQFQAHLLVNKTYIRL